MKPIRICIQCVSCDDKVYIETTPERMFRDIAIRYGGNGHQHERNSPDAKTQIWESHIIMTYEIPRDMSARVQQVLSTMRGDMD